MIEPRSEDPATMLFLEDTLEILGGEKVHELERVARPLLLALMLRLNDESSNGLLCARLG